MGKFASGQFLRREMMKMGSIPVNLTLKGHFSQKNLRKWESIPLKIRPRKVSFVVQSVSDVISSGQIFVLGREPAFSAVQWSENLDLVEFSPDCE